MNQPLHNLKTVTPILTFGIRLLLFGALLCGAAWYLQTFTTPVFLSPYFWTISIFLYCATFFAYGISLVGIRGHAEMGVFAILGGIIVKMIVSLTFFMYLYYKFKHPNSVTLGLNFFCVYFFFTGFEVINLLRNLRSKLKKEKINY